MYFATMKNFLKILRKRSENNSKKLSNIHSTAEQRIYSILLKILNIFTVQNIL